jgi:hypothetical protein
MQSAPTKRCPSGLLRKDLSHGNRGSGSSGRRRSRRNWYPKPWHTPSHDGVHDQPSLPHSQTSLCVQLWFPTHQRRKTVVDSQPHMLAAANVRVGFTRLHSQTPVVPCISTTPTTTRVISVTLRRQATPRGYRLRPQYHHGADTTRACCELLADR